MLHIHPGTHVPRLVKTSGVLLVVSLAMVLLPRYFASGTAATGLCDVPSAQIAPLDTEEAKLLQLINDYRAANGAGPLTISYTLSQSAQWKSNDMVANNYYDHADVFLGGRAPTERFFDCGYAYDGIDRGENIDLSLSSTADAVLGAWESSDSHNAAMLDPNFHVIGIGRTYSANFAGTGTPAWMWTADFGEYDDGASYRAPLPNDNFANASLVTALPYHDGPVATFDTAVISTERGESGGPVLTYWAGGNCGMGRTAWYKLTPSTDMTVQADTYGSDFDTVIAVYTGSTLNNLSLVSCNDQAPYHSPQSMVQFQAKAGVTYYIQAGKYWINNIYWNLQGVGSMNDYLKVNLSCVSCSAGTPTATAASSSTATPSPSATPSPTSTLASTATASLTPSPTATASPTASPTPTPTPEPAPAPAIDPVVDPPITQPTDGAIVPAGKTITIAATANGTNGISKVEFYVNGVRKCSDSTSPYTCGWGVPNTKGVVYTLTAKAYDPQGNTASDSITVTSGHDGLPPSVSLTSPVSGSTVAAGKVVSIAATAADEVGVAKVDFYVNGVRKCTDKLAPYVCNWTVPNGAGVTYTLVARAYDAQGNASYSPAVTVTSR